MINSPVAIAAVAAACRVTRHVQNRQQHIERHSKDDMSPVTVADYAAQAVIARHLADAFGGLTMVGEEDAATLREAGRDGVARGSGRSRARWPGRRPGVDDVLDAIDLGNHDASGARYWTLDPIDGTKGFLRGGQYAVSLALIEKGQVVLGVLGCPNLSADYSRSFDAPTRAAACSTPCAAAAAGRCRRTSPPMLTAPPRRQSRGRHHRHAHL